MSDNKPYAFGDYDQFQDWAEEDEPPHEAAQPTITQPTPLQAQIDQLRNEYGAYWEQASQLKAIERSFLPTHKKWGWPVYRTTYSDDAKWQKFNNIFQDTLRARLTKYLGTTDHLQHMHWPVREDSGLFNNATTSEIRTHFLAWRASGGPAEEQGASAADAPRFVETSPPPRFDFFIFVDDAAMESVLAREHDRFSESYVNVVQADWPPADDEEEMANIEAESGFDEIEGRRTRDVGFSRVAMDFLYPTHWVDVDGGLLWEHWYERPPKVIHWS